MSIRQAFVYYIKNSLIILSIKFVNLCERLKRLHAVPPER